MEERKRRKTKTWHGMANTKLYRCWAAIIQRCTNPNNNLWPDYGGRGIYICDRWRHFELFYADMGERPNGASLDRIDNSGPYSPENCRWATQKEQCRNTRANIILKFNNIQKTLPEWSEIVGIDRQVIYLRIRNGWPVEKALTTPKKIYKK